MPKPKKDEKRKDFIKRCIPIVMKEGAEKEHAIGKCYGIFKHNKGKK